MLEEFEKIRYTRTLEAKEQREKLLKQMTNEEIDKIIETSGNTSAKIYYSSFKKEK